MRSHPSCWNKTLAQLGFKRKRRKNKQRRDHLRRRSLFENLEQRQMLTADPLLAGTFEQVVIATPGVQPSALTFSAEPEFVLIQPEIPTDTLEGLTDEEIANLEPLFQVETIQTDDGPRAIVSFNPNHPVGPPSSLQELRLELHQHGQIRETYHILIDVADESFRAQFLADRAEEIAVDIEPLQRGEIASSLTRVGTSQEVAEAMAFWNSFIGPKTLDQERQIEALHNGQVDKSADEIDFSTEELLSVAKGRSNSDAFRRPGISTEQFYGVIEKQTDQLKQDRLSATTPAEQQSVAEQAAQLKKLTLLVAKDLQQDLHSEDADIASSAQKVRDELVAISDPTDLLFAGLGVDNEVERKVNNQGDEKAVSFIETGRYVFDDQLEVDLGDQPAMVQVTRLSKQRLPAATSVSGSPAVEDGWIDQANPTANGGSSTTLHVDGTAAAQQETLIRFDLNEVGDFSNPTTITSAALQLTEATTGSGNAELYVWNGLFGGTSGSATDWDETNTTWNHVDGTLGLDNNLDEFTFLGAWNSGTTTEVDVTAQIQRALLYGDANGDGVFGAVGIDGDIEAFHLAVTNWDAYVAEYGPRANSTANLLARTDGGLGDGIIDTNDITDFFRRHGYSQGDYNLDGTVQDNQDSGIDGRDWAVFDANYGLTNARFSQGDGNFDGVVDDDDFVIWFDRKGEDNLTAEEPELVIWARPEDTTTDIEFAAQEHLTLDGPTLVVTEQPDLALNKFTVDGSNLVVDYAVLGDTFTDVKVQLYKAGSPDTLLHETAVQSGALGSHEVLIATSVLSSIVEGDSVYAKVVGTPSSGAQSNTANDELDFEFSTASTQVVTSLDDLGMDQLRRDKHTLRELLAANESLGWFDTITFDESLFGVEQETITLGDHTGDNVADRLHLYQDVIIAGPGASRLAIDARDQTQVMLIETNQDVTLSGLTLTGGYATGHAGGIYNRGQLTLDSVSVVDNQASSHGGGIFLNSTGTLELNSSTLDGNQAFIGGGLSATTLAIGASLTIDSSTISNNTSSGSTGGVSVVGTNGASATEVLIVNSTFSGNSAGASAGGLRTQTNVELTIVNSTFHNNSAVGSGGGLYPHTGTTTLMHNTIVAGNTTGSFPWQADMLTVNAFDPASSHNLIGIDHPSTGLTDGVNGNQIGTSTTPLDAELAPLADIGGPTKTHVPLTTSPAIGGADSLLAPAVDQTGFAALSGSNTTVGAVTSDLQIEVNTNADRDISAGLRSLRQSFELAYQREESTVLLAPTLDNKIQLVQGAMALDGQVSIEGSGAGALESVLEIYAQPGSDALVIGSRTASSTYTFENVKITGNTPNPLITTFSGDVTFRNAEISGNQSGIGIANVSANLTVERSIVSGNETGIYNQSGTLTLDETTVSDNVNATGPGGGIYAGLGSTTTVLNSTISGNSATDGGGIYATLFDEAGAPAKITVENSTISENAATNRGGGIYARGVTVTLTNATIANNYGEGGGVFAAPYTRDSGTTGILTANNSIIAANHTSDGNTANDIAGTLDFDVTSSHNLIGTPTTGNEANGLAHNPVGTGNIVGDGSGGTVDPRLSALGSYGGLTQTHTPLFGSPAIDAGSDSLIGTLTTDQRGYIRSNNSRTTGALADFVDIGAVETGTFVSTDSDVTDVNYTLGNLSLREAISLAPTSDKSLIEFAPALLGASIQLDNGELLIDRSVDIAGPGATLLTVDANADAGTPGRVFRVTGASTESELSGLTITGGYVIGNGGAILNTGSDLSLSHVIVRNNEATGLGGGIFSNDGTVNLQATKVQQNASTANAGGGLFVDGVGSLTIGANSLISDNTAVQGGGGLYVRNSDLELSDSEVVRNVSSAGGGVRINTDGNNSLRIFNTRIESNESTVDGGGIHLSRSASGPAIELTVERGVIEDNTAQDEGGGVYITDGSINITESEIESNSATAGGGGYVRFSTGDSLTLTNSSVAGNVAENADSGTTGGGFYVFAPSGPTIGSVQITGTTFAHNVSRDLDADGSANNTAGGLYLLRVANTDIENSTFSGNQSDESGGGLRLEASGPAAITNSTIAYNESLAADAGGIWVENGSAAVELHNTILAENRGILDDPADLNERNIVGSIDSSSSFNLLGPLGASESLSLGAGNELLNPSQSAGLAALAEYGGTLLPSGSYVKTHALMSDSIAIDEGSSSVPEFPSLDQRGLGRENFRLGPSGDIVDIGAYEAQKLTIEAQDIVGDFNGDGRPDDLYIEGSSGKIDVALGGISTAGSALWADLVGSGWKNLQVGDYNGDGRDDLALQQAIAGVDNDIWYVAISDSTRFSVTQISNDAGDPIVSEWDVTSIGDFDGDGSDELIGRKQRHDGTGQGAVWSSWEVVQFDEKLGSSIETWRSSFAGAPDWAIYIGDTNRDGRDDLIGRAASEGADWRVDLSLPSEHLPMGVEDTPGNNGNFTGTTNWGDWFSDTNVDLSPGLYRAYERDETSVDAGGSYRKLTEVFASVYNDIELELYAGIKKGPDATEATKSGNPWDQAALLVQRIDDAIMANELPDVVEPTIVGGRITVPIDVAKDWLGATSTDAVVPMLSSMDMDLDLDPNLVDSEETVVSDGVTVTFDHAWVRVSLPTLAGLESDVDLDPSWKFKDYQTGIDLHDVVTGHDLSPSTVPNYSNQGLFEEFEYLESSVAGNPGSLYGIAPDDVIIGRETPLEYFEGQVQQYLIENQPGMSLADVPYTGPLGDRVIDSLPSGLDSAVAESGTPVEYGTYAELTDPLSTNYAANFQALTYRFRFSVISTSPWAIEDELNGNFSQYDRFEQDPVTHFSTDTYAFHTHGHTEWNLVTSENVSGQMDFDLFIDGVDAVPDYSGTRDLAPAVALTPHPRLFVEVFGPGESISAAPSISTVPAFEAFVEDSYANQLLEPESTYALGIDLNQYSSADIENLADQLRDEVAVNNSPDDAYDELANLAVAEFLLEKNRSLRQVGDLMLARYQSSYGFVIAESANEQITENFPTYDTSTSPYGTVPRAFELNELRQTARYFDLSSSDAPAEASQLGLWQASSDQAEIQEKLLAADSGKSTLRLMQRAFAGQVTVRTNGPNLNIYSAGFVGSQNGAVQVYETTVNQNGYPELKLLGNARPTYAHPSSAPGRTYDNPNAAPNNPNVWTSTTLLADITNDTILGTVRDSLESAIKLHLRTYTEGNANATLLPELVAYFSDSLSVQNGAGHLSDTRVLMPYQQLSLGGWEGSGFFGERLDTGLGTFVVDRFGDEELTGYIHSTGNVKPPLQQPGASGQIADALVGSASGNVTSNATDILFPNIGVPLNFNRTYSSNYEIQLDSGQTQVARDMGLGLGWMHRFGDRLYVDNPDTSNPDLVWFRSTGQAHRFVYENGDYVVPTELLGQFKVLDGGGFEYLERDGMRYEFELTDESGNTAGNIYARLSGITDRSDNGFEIIYDNATVDHIQAAQDVHDSDRRLEFDYAQQGTDVNRHRITDIRKYDSGGHIGTWTYQYDEIDVPDSDPPETTWHLNSVTTPQESNVPGGFVTTYDYYDPTDVGLEGADEFAGLLKKITSPNGDHRRFEYYLNRRKFREITSANQTSEDFATTSKTYSYNPVANTTDITDERGNVTTLSYQPNGLQLRKINPDRTRTVNTWGEIGSDEEFLIKSSTDEIGATESYEYYTQLDVDNELAEDWEQRQLKESTSKRFLLANGTLVVGPHPALVEGIVTRYDYRQGERKDLITMIPIHEHIVDTQTVTVENPYGANYVTTYSYDPATDLTSSVRNARNEETHYTYYTTPTHDGLVETQTRPKTNGGADFVTTYTYDAAGNLESSSTDTVELSTTQYDHNGQPILVTETGPNGVAYESIYDKIGRLHSTRLGDGSGLVAGGPDGSLPEFENSFVYDLSGQIKESTDRNGNTTYSDYDQRGNIIKRTNPDGTFITFKYDEASNLIEQADELGRISRFVYDSRNRLIQTIHPDGAVDRTYYDGVGRISVTLDARDNRTSITYDAEGRQLTVTNAEENTTTNRYDDLGRLTSTQDFRGNFTVFEHDQLGRVVETRILAAGETLESTSPDYEFVSTTEYDANGNVFRTAVYDIDLILTEAPTGGTVQPSFPSDPTDLLTSEYLTDGRPFLQVTETAYDSLDRPTSTTFIGASADGSGQDVTVDTHYNAAGRVDYTEDELDRRTTFAYDAYGRLVKTTYPDPDGEFEPKESPVERQTYDAVGNVVSVIDANGHVTTNEYDFLNRLVSSIDAEGNTTRTVYDVAGQMVATIDPLGRGQYLAYDNRGRVKREQTADPDGDGPFTPLATVYDYDLVGNRISTENANGYFTKFDYDELNRLETEFTTDVQIYDIDDHTTDPNFLVENGDPTSSGDVEQSFARDHVDVSGNANVPEFSWTFENLEAGEKYSLSLTWDGHTSLDSGAMAVVTVQTNAGVIVGDPLPTVTINQAQDPHDYALDYQGQWRGWQRLATKIENVPQNGKIVVTVTGSSPTATIRADALMLDRQVTRSLQYDGNGNLLTQTDVLGRTTTNVYDSRNLLTQTTLPDPDQGKDNGGPGGANLAAPVIDQAYDGFGNVIEIVERRGTAEDRTQKLTYDRRNRLVSTTLNYEDGNYQNNFKDQDIITQNVYDDVGNLRLTVNALGSPEQTIDAFDYDELNRLVTEHIDISVTTANNDYGTALSSSNSRTPYEHRNEHEYDPAGNLIRTESFTHDPTIAGTPDETSVVSIFEYDDINRLVRQTDDYGTQANHVNATSRTIYDAVSNVLQSVDPTGRVSTNEYDRLNRVTKTTMPAPGDGQVAPFMLYVYDTLGNVARTTNSENETTQSIYDTLGREISRFDANDDETRYRYDAFGNLLSLIDAEDNVTAFEYDALDRIKTDTIKADNGSDLIRTYIYDDSQNLKRYIDRNGRGVEYTYDDLDRLTTEDWHASGSFAGAIETLQWEYDAVGRVTQAVSDVADFLNPGDLDYEASWLYDNLDRVTKARNFALTGNRFNPQYVINYKYDIVDLGSNTAPHQTTATHFIEPANTTIAAKKLSTVTYASDRLGRILSIGELDATQTTYAVTTKDIGFTYDDAGRMLSTNRTGGSLSFDTVYGYDGTGRLDALTHTTGDAQPFASYRHTYDSASRIIDRIRRLNTSVTALQNLEAYRSETFGFDEAGQLLERDASDGVGVEESYNYDENGNRTDANGNPYDTDKNNRVASDGVYNYTYDNEGNLTEKYIDSPGSPNGMWDGSEQGIQFRWDHRNRLVEVIHRDGAANNIAENIYYAYDNDNLRIRKVVQDVTQITTAEQFVYDGSQLAATIDINATGNTLGTTGSLGHRYLNGTDVDDLLVDEAFTGMMPIRWAASDHLGSVSQLLDNSGQIVEHREFDAFGNISALYNSTGSTDGTVGAPDLTALDSVFAFTGREWDNDASLYYNRARWLDPNLGRFISVDPLGFDAGDANLYRYSGNDPLNRFDPSGESWLSSIFDTIGDVFKKVGREIGRVFEDIGDFVVDTIDYIGDKIDSTIDTFEYIIKNPEDFFKGLISDPLTWGTIALGSIFTASFSWGFFDFNIGLGGINYGTNLLELGRKTLDFVTGGNFSFGLPTVQGSSKVFDSLNFTRKINANANGLMIIDPDVISTAYSNSDYARLPSGEKGTWDGTPGDSTFTFKKKSLGSIRYDKGQPDFSSHVYDRKGVRGVVEIDLADDLSLSDKRRRKLDTDAAIKAMQEKYKGWKPPSSNRFVWHHQNVNRITGKGQMVLVSKRIHTAAAHEGAFAIYRNWLKARASGVADKLNPFNEGISRLGVIGRAAKVVAAPLAFFSASSIASNGYANGGLPGASDALMRDLVWADEVESILRPVGRAYDDWFDVERSNFLIGQAAKSGDTNLFKQYTNNSAKRATKPNPAPSSSTTRSWWQQYKDQWWW